MFSAEWDKTQLGSQVSLKSYQTHVVRMLLRREQTKPWGRRLAVGSLRASRLFYDSRFKLLKLGS